MDETLPNTTISTDATLFREEAERARRYAAAMIDKKVIDRLNEIAPLYDQLAAGQDSGLTDHDKKPAVLHSLGFPSGRVTFETIAVATPSRPGPISRMITSLS